MKTNVASLIVLISLLIIGYLGDGAAASFSEQNLTVLTLECGGLIRTDMLTSESSYKLRYKPNGNNSRTKENCLWTLDNASVKRRYYVKARVTLLDTDLFETSGAAISILDWNFRSKSTDAVLSHKELRKNSPTYMSSDWDYKLFLSYTSASNTRNTAESGFLVRIDILSTDSPTYGKNCVFTSSSGTEKFGPYPQHHRFSLVLNPHQMKTTFKVHFVDSKKMTFCSGADTLDIYEIHTRSGPKTLARFCGSLTTPLSYTSEFPILSTFSTFKTTSGKGFQISWE